MTYDGRLWPAHWWEPDSCVRHRRCMYLRCPHSEMTQGDLELEMEAEMEAREEGPVTPPQPTPAPR